MSRWFSHSLTLTPRLPPKSWPLLLLRRTQSNHSSRRDSNLTDQPDSASSSADPLLRKLEDAIYRIIVRRSAPDWLPFVPGASYWVPPLRSGPFGVAQFLEKLTNPLSDEESMSTTSTRGWPSSAYFFKGASPHPVEDESISSNVSNDEDEEG